MCVIIMLSLGNDVRCIETSNSRLLLTFLVLKTL